MARQVAAAAFGAMLVVLLVAAAAADGSSQAVQTTDWAYGLALQRDGKLVAAGYTRASGEDSFASARYTPRRPLDRTFGSGGKVVTVGLGSASAVAVQTDGRIVVAGQHVYSNGCCLAIPPAVPGALARYMPGGGLDSGFGSGGKATTGFAIASIAIEPGGKIVAGG